MLSLDPGQDRSIIENGSKNTLSGLDPDAAEFSAEPAVHDYHHQTHVEPILGSGAHS